MCFVVNKFLHLFQVLRNFQNTATAINAPPSPLLREMQKKNRHAQLTPAISKNNRNMLKGTCSVCGTTKNKFVSATKGGDLTYSINKFTSKLKLP